MSKAIVFGEKPKEGVKPIQLKRLLQESGTFSNTTTFTVSVYEYIMLMQKHYCDNIDPDQHMYDLIWCYDNNPNDGTLFLGHWNDGIIEE